MAVSRGVAPPASLKQPRIAPWVTGILMRMAFRLFYSQPLRRLKRFKKLQVHKKAIRARERRSCTTTKHRCRTYGGSSPLY